jgi:hypothetical protein
MSAKIRGVFIILPIHTLYIWHCTCTLPVHVSKYLPDSLCHSTEVYFVSVQLSRSLTIHVQGCGSSCQRP